MLRDNLPTMASLPEGYHTKYAAIVSRRIAEFTATSGQLYRVDYDGFIDEEHCYSLNVFSPEEENWIHIHGVCFSPEDNTFKLGLLSMFFFEKVKD